MAQRSACEDFRAIELAQPAKRLQIASAVELIGL
jgi:hypothetical protein